MRGGKQEEEREEEREGKEREKRRVGKRVCCFEGRLFLCQDKEV